MSYEEGFPMDNYPETQLSEIPDTLCYLLLVLALWKASFQVMRDMAVYLLIMIAYLTIKFGNYRSFNDLINSIAMNTICYGVLKFITNLLRRKPRRHNHVNHRTITYVYRT